MDRLSLVLTPRGSLLCEKVVDAPALDDALAKRLRAAFAMGAGPGLLRLGAGEVEQSLPPVLAWWRDFSGRCLTGLCQAPDQTDAGVLPSIAELSDPELAALVASAPLMTGAEYLTASILADLWTTLLAAVQAAMRDAKTNPRALIAGFNPAWDLGLAEMCPLGGDRPLGLVRARYRAHRRGADAWQENHANRPSRADGGHRGGRPFVRTHPPDPQGEGADQGGSQNPT